MSDSPRKPAYVQVEMRQPLNFPVNQVPPELGGDANVFLSTRRVSNDGIIVRGRRPSNGDTTIVAGRQGSAANLMINPDGTVTAMRRQSSQDTTIAVSRRLSHSSQPNLLNVLGVQPSGVPAVGPPLMGAQDAIDRTKGLGELFEHMWDLDVLAEKYATHIDVHNVDRSEGLKTEKAEALLEEFGPNVLTPPPRVPLWVLFLLQFANLLMVLLMITGLLCFILYATDTSNPTNLYLGVLLYIVVFLTCYETFTQEAKSDSLMEKFRAMIPAAASIVRDGQITTLSTTLIVPGDMIRLKTGDKVPADCRVIASHGMKVDQAMITGESEPIDISVQNKSTNPLEAKNMVFNGSLVVEGACTCIAVRTGDATLMGKMVDLTGDIGKSSSTLQADIVYFVRVLTLFALFQAVLVFIVGCSRGIDPASIFVQGFVVIMIGNVPQGLPTTITACLFIIADRMGKQNVFVKKLDIIECLGSCTCICTDKTGTLTQNLMSVANVWFMNVTQNHVEFQQRLSAEYSSKVSPQMRQLIDVAALCSRVTLETDTSPDAAPNAVKPLGDATELGLYRFFGGCLGKDYGGEGIEPHRSGNPKVHEIPFNSKNKWQMSVHTLAGQAGKQIICMKGAPDVLLNKCSRYISVDGTIANMDMDFTTAYNTVYENFGGNGERVLGFAMLPLDRPFEEELEADPEFKEKLAARLVGADRSNAITNLVFVGLVTLRDPPRDEVPQAIKECYSAGVKVVMVTGDHPLTAEAIARNIGLITAPTVKSLARERGISEEKISKTDPEIGAVVVRGIEISGGTEVINGQSITIPAMMEDDWKLLLSRKEIVFARTSPENKLTIVKEFTKAGHVTAMTGDGVNDSPALKQAAIGIAMGMNGSDVAREAADIVLLDDNFASIVVGIREGRLLFNNLKKSIAYTLAHLVPEVIPVLLWAFVGTPQPMASLLALCIDLLTDLAPSSALAYEPAESNIMQVPPRDCKKDRLTSFPLLFYAYGQAGMILTGGCLFVFFATFQKYGVTPRDIFVMNNKYFPSVKGHKFTTSTGAVYDAHEQNEIFKIVQGAWYVMIFSGQAAHIWMCRTCTVSIFQHGLCSNMYVTWGTLLAIALGCFVAYCPGIIDIVGSAKADTVALNVFEAMLWVSFALWGWAEGRKWFTRSYPEHFLNKYLAW
jgi:sodium/potassium-transporting ATPase subunit alpha